MIFPAFASAVHGDTGHPLVIEPKSKKNGIKKVSTVEESKGGTNYKSLSRRQCICQVFSPTTTTTTTTAVH